MSFRENVFFRVMIYYSREEIGGGFDGFTVFISLFLFILLVSFFFFKGGDSLLVF